MNKPLTPKVVVNGEEISAAEIAAEAQNHAAPKGKPGFAWRAAARALTIRLLALQEAKRQGLEPDPLEVEPGRFETDEEAMIRAVMDVSIDPKPPTEAIVKKAYLAAPTQFRAPSLFEPAHILFAANPDDADAREKARSSATAMLETLTKSPGDFARLAKENSDCQSAANGGQLGQISPGETVPEFETAMNGLEAGNLHTTPVETRYGYHVLKMNAKAIGDVLPFEAVKEQITEGLEKAAWAHAARKFTADLIAKADLSGVDFA